MSRRGENDVVPAGHPRHDDLEQLVAQLADLPAEVWSPFDVPAIDPPPEIATPAASARPRPRWRLRLLGGLAVAGAAAAVAIVALGGTPTEEAPVTASLRAVESGSSASGQVQRSGDRVLVSLDGLAPVGSGASYEAWSLADPERPRSLGTITPDAGGAAEIDATVKGELAEVAVTREPADDTPGPSGDFVLRSSAS